MHVTEAQSANAAAAPLDCSFTSAHTTYVRLSYTLNLAKLNDEIIPRLTQTKFYSCFWYSEIATQKTREMLRV